MFDNKKAKESKELMIEKSKSFTQPSKEELNLWRALAVHYKIRLPMSYLPSTSDQISKYLRKLDISRETMRDYFGEGWKITDFNKLNPDKGAIFFVGNLLEIKIDSDGLIGIDRFYNE